MVTLQTLETQGYDRAFFRLPSVEEQAEHFTYYTYDTNLPSYYLDDWDIVGVHRRNEVPLLFDLVFLHIDEVALDWEPFEALRDAINYISVTPPQFRAVIRFFEGLVDVEDRGSVPEEQPLTHFQQLEKEALLSLHLQPLEMEQLIGRYYRYAPNEDVQDKGQMSLVAFPFWSPLYGQSQAASLTIETFEEQELIDPQFNPFGSTEWLGRITFDQPALEEFIRLLKKHSYENTIGGA